jgi:hypothetical protein
VTEGSNPPSAVSPHEQFTSAAAIATEAGALDMKIRKEFIEAKEKAERDAIEKADKAQAAGEAALAVNEQKAEAVTSKVADAVTSSLDKIEGITLADGKFQISNDIGDEAIANGLTTLSSMIGAGNELSQGFALMEAQFAMAVEDIGRDWKLYYDLDDPQQKADAKRIGQGAKALRKMDDYGAELPDAKISLIRNVMEAKYSKDAADNATRAKKLCADLEGYYKQNGKYPPQLEIRDMVRAAKAGNTTPVRPSFVYVIPPVNDGDPIRVVGTKEEHEGLSAMSVAMIHLGSTSYKIEGFDGAGNGVTLFKADPLKIPEPDAAILELADQYVTTDETEEEEEDKHVYDDELEEEEEGAEAPVEEADDAEGEW